MTTTRPTHEDVVKLRAFWSREALQDLVQLGVHCKSIDAFQREEQAKGSQQRPFRRALADGLAGTLSVYSRCLPCLEILVQQLVMLSSASMALSLSAQQPDAMIVAELLDVYRTAILQLQQAIAGSTVVATAALQHHLHDFQVSLCLRCSAGRCSAGREA